MQISYHEIERKHYHRVTSAPNGSTVNNDEYWTHVISNQVWADVPENGKYAGLEYKIVDRYVSPVPHMLGQKIDSSSMPWR